MKLDQTHLKPGGKHVSKACLECRRRHFKCDGQIPNCARCLAKGTQCVYVDSHRGGARRKGVSTRNGNTNSNKNSQSSSPNSIDIEDLGSKKLLARKNEVADDGFIDSLRSLPCAQDGSQCTDLECPAKDLVLGKTAITPQTIESVRKRIKLDTSIKNLHCMFAPKHEQPKEVNNMDFLMDYTNVENKMSLNFDKGEIIKRYYANFHEAHPLLPPKDELDTYLQNSSAANELLFIMKIIGDGQMGSLYSKDVNFIQDRLVQAINLVNESVHDLISLQVLMLVSLIAHISSLHDFSRNIRQYCIHLTKKLQINMLDSVTKPINVFESPRLAHISRTLVADNARRTFWELYFFDVIIGSADGITITNLSKIPVEVEYPSFPPSRHFDYKGRSETSKLVTQAIIMNNEIKNKRPYDISLTKLKAQLSNWEMKFFDPSVYGAPELIHKDGTVNEGVHQSIIMFNYAKIFAHRPFSYLWKTSAPQNPRCDDNVLDADDIPVQLRADAKATVETIKTIASANSILELLMDTNAANLLERTPLFACALALASLVYTSAYIWVETLIEQNDEDLIKSSRLGANDLEVYGEYIKLSLSAIYPISRHWILSGKLATHVRSALQALRPKLYSKLKDSLPQIQISIENMDLSDKGVETKDNGQDIPKKREDTVSTSATSNYITPVFDSISPNSISSVNSNGVTAHAEQANNIMKVPSLTSTTTSGNTFTYEDQFDGNVISDNIVPEDPFDPLNLGSPLSDTGCDWIDKALLDFFEGDRVNIM